MKTQTLSKRDKYLRTKFNRTEEEFDKVFEQQGKVCRICGAPPGTRNLHLDHDHFIEKIKIRSVKENGLWRAWPEGRPATASPLNFEEKAKTKPLAIGKVRKRLLRLSARGILCWKCNTGLKKWNDNAKALREAADYLDRYFLFLMGQDTGEGFKS